MPRPRAPPQLQLQLLPLLLAACAVLALGACAVLAGTLESIEPAEGPVTGGTVITITGDVLGSGSDIVSVTIGGAEAALGAQSETSVEVTTPACAPPCPFAGSTVVVTSTSVGATSCCLVYRYLAAGQVTSVVPSEGPLGGNTTVTVVGVDLGSGEDITMVHIGALTADIISQTADSAIVSTPECANTCAPGSYQVTVTSESRGTSSSQAQYTYFPAATISSISPVSAPLGGHVLVTIHGSSLSRGSDLVSKSQVLVGDAPVVQIVSQALESVVVRLGECATPDCTAGLGDVTIESAAFGSATLEDAFTYTGGHSISFVEPSQGPLTGGRNVTVVGAALACSSAEELTITFGGVSAARVIEHGQSYAVVETAACTSPCTPGDVTVAATSSCGGSTSATGLFKVHPAGTASSVTPSDVAPLSGTTVSIVGTNLAGNSTSGDRVRVGLLCDVSATCRYWTAYGISQASPSLVKSSLPVCLNTSVCVGNVQGVVDSSLYGLTLFNIELNPVPELSFIEPTSVPMSGSGQVVTVFGSNLLRSGLTALDLNLTVGMLMPTIVNATDSWISFLAPDCDDEELCTGPQTVIVSQTRIGTASLSDAFEINPSGIVLSARPSSGPSGLSVTITLAGANLGNGSDIERVMIGPIPARRIVEQTGNVVTVETNPCLSSECIYDTLVSVSVYSPTFGTSNGSFVFTYNSPPSVSRTSPTYGPVTGDFRIEVFGKLLSTRLDNLTDVYLGAAKLDVVDRAAANTTLYMPACTTCVAGNQTLRAFSQLFGPWNTTFELRAPVVLVASSPPLLPLDGGTLVNVTTTGTLIASELLSATLGGSPATIVSIMGNTVLLRSTFCSDVRYCNTTVVALRFTWGILELPDSVAYYQNSFYLRTVEYTAPQNVLIMLLVFTQPVSFVDISTCSFVSAESLLNFGSGASCSRFNDTTVAVQLGVSPRLDSTRAVEMVGGLYNATREQQASGYVRLTAPPTLVVPTAVLTAQTAVVDECTNFTLSGLSSTGTAGVALRPTWTLVSGTTTAELTALLASANTAQWLSILITPSMLVPGTYTFGLVVKNWLQATSAQANLTIERSAVPQDHVYITPHSGRFRPGQTVNLAYTLQKCSGNALTGVRWSNGDTRSTTSVTMPQASAAITSVTVTLEATIGGNVVNDSATFTVVHTTFVSPEYGSSTAADTPLLFSDSTLASDQWVLELSSGLTAAAVTPTSLASYNTIALQAASDAASPRTAAVTTNFDGLRESYSWAPSTTESCAVAFQLRSDVPRRRSMSPSSDLTVLLRASRAMKVTLEFVDTAYSPVTVLASVTPADVSGTVVTVAASNLVANNSMSVVARAVDSTSSLSCSLPLRTVAKPFGGSVSLSAAAFQAGKDATMTFAGWEDAEGVQSYDVLLASSRIVLGSSYSGTVSFVFPAPSSSGSLTLTARIHSVSGAVAEVQVKTTLTVPSNVTTTSQELVDRLTSNLDSGNWPAALEVLPSLMSLQGTSPVSSTLFQTTINAVLLVAQAAQNLSTSTSAVSTLVSVVTQVTNYGGSSVWTMRSSLMPAVRQVLRMSNSFSLSLAETANIWTMSTSVLSSWRRYHDLTAVRLAWRRKIAATAESRDAATSASALSDTLTLLAETLASVSSSLNCGASSPLTSDTAVGWVEQFRTTGALQRSLSNATTLSVSASAVASLSSASCSVLHFALLNTSVVQSYSAAFSPLQQRVVSRMAMFRLPGASSSSSSSSSSRASTDAVSVTLSLTSVSASQRYYCFASRDTVTFTECDCTLTVNEAAMQATCVFASTSSLRNAAVTMFVTDAPPSYLAIYIGAPIGLVVLIVIIAVPLALRQRRRAALTSGITSTELKRMRSDLNFVPTEQELESRAARDARLKAAMNRLDAIKDVADINIDVGDNSDDSSEANDAPTAKPRRPTVPGMELGALAPPTLGNEPLGLSPRSGASAESGGGDMTLKDVCEALGVGEQDLRGMARLVRQLQDREAAEASGSRASQRLDLRHQSIRPEQYGVTIEQLQQVVDLVTELPLSLRSELGLLLTATEQAMLREEERQRREPRARTRSIHTNDSGDLDLPGIGTLSLPPLAPPPTDDLNAAFKRARRASAVSVSSQAGRTRRKSNVSAPAVKANRAESLSILADDSDDETDASESAMTLADVAENLAVSQAELQGFARLVRRLLEQSGHAVRPQVKKLDIDPKKFGLTFAQLQELVDMMIGLPPHIRRQLGLTRESATAGVSLRVVPPTPTSATNKQHRRSASLGQAPAILSEGLWAEMKPVDSLKEPAAPPRKAAEPMSSPGLPPLPTRGPGPRSPEVPVPIEDPLSARRGSKRSINSGSSKYSELSDEAHGDLPTSPGRRGSNQSGRRHSTK